MEIRKRYRSGYSNLSFYIRLLVIYLLVVVPAGFVFRVFQIFGEINFISGFYAASGCVEGGNLVGKEFVYQFAIVLAITAAGVFLGLRIKKNIYKTLALCRWYFLICLVWNVLAADFSRFTPYERDWFASGAVFLLQTVLPVLINLAWFIYLSVSGKMKDACIRMNRIKCNLAGVESMHSEIVPTPKRKKREQRVKVQEK